MEYKALLKKIDNEDLLEKSRVKLIGYQNTIKEARGYIKSSTNFMTIGPSGTGKTTFLRKLAEESGQHYVYLNAIWMQDRAIGDPTTLIRTLFREAIQFAPSIIFIDEIDQFFDKKRPQPDLERISNSIKDRLEYLSRNSHKTSVMVATSRPEVLDPGLTKYFDFKVHFALPNRNERIEMLKTLFPKFKSIELDHLADATHCYLFNDLKRLRMFALITGTLSLESVKLALKKVKPATVENYTTPSPPIRWEDIGGFEDVKRELQCSVIDPIKNRERYEEFCEERDRGALLYGPPGCSKTMLAQALATESGFNFISIKGPELFSKYVGDSEAAVRRLYRNAREISPCIIFLDEIDGLATDRSQDKNSSVGDKIVTQLLTQFNEPHDDVFTIAATNRPHRVDKALLRPGRLGSKIYIPLPSESDRTEIFKVKMRRRAHKYDRPVDELAKILAARTMYYSGADIVHVVKTAGLSAFREKGCQSIELRHLETALETVKPSTNVGDLKYFNSFYQDCRKSGQRESLAGDPLRGLSDSFSDTLNLD